MKNIIILFTLVSIFKVYSYTLENKWLVPETVQVSQTSLLYNHVFAGTRDSLANFNYAGCINDMNSAVVDKMPSLVPVTMDGSSSCIVTYGHIFDVNGQFDPDLYGLFSTVIATAPGEFAQFTITLNDSARMPWGSTSPSSSVVDINTTLRHEVGHALGIFHSQFSSSLMYEKPTLDPWTNPILFIANDEINGLRNVYTPPKLKNVSSSTSQYQVNSGDTIMVFTKDTLTIDLETAEMLIFSGVVPPSLKPDTFMNSTTLTDTLAYTNVGTNLYRYKIPTDNLNLSTINLLRTFVRRSSMNHDLSNYDTQNSPISKLYIDVKNRQCRVDLPLPATESWFDFETRLNAAGSILAEPSFADSLDNVYVVFDIYDDYWSAYLTELFQEEYHLSIFSEVYAENNLFIDSNVYFCDFEKKAKTLQLDRRFPTHDLKSMTNKMDSKKFIELQKPNISKNNSKDLTVYPAEPYRYRYPKSLDLWPGSYTVHMIAFRKDIWDTYGIVSEIAKCDSMQFIIPLWKMKLRRDYWYANTVVPYKQNLEYEAGKTMQILLWQPISWGPYNILNIDVVRETDSTVVDNFTVDFDDKAAGVLVEWDIPAETVPGFYNLKASNVDYYTNIPVNQQIDPQVCPLYLSWENYGDWPDNWSGSDNADWKIHPAEAWTPAMGAYALGAKYSTEGNTGQVSIQKSFSIDSEWDRILEFAIGVPKFYGVTNFDPLLADYSIAISEDGANWTYEKTAAISEYYNYNWAVDTMYCFNKTIKPLGKPSNIFVKFIKKGIVTTPPDSQFVLFDEVKVMLTKTPTKTGPSDPNAQYAGGNVNVGWSGVAKGDKALDNYYVYRNGIKIGETTAVTFVDSTVSANTFYNYAITAHYDDGSTYPESPMNECSVSIYTGLYSPSNLVITNENPNIKLTWSPVSGASEYKVYSSNDPYGTFAEDTSGTFNGEEWIAPLSSSRLFYYVVAVNESMKEKKIIKEINHRVK